MQLVQRFLEANRGFCLRVLKPRVVTVSHMAAVEWWLSKRVSGLAQRADLLEFGSGKTFPVTRMVGHHFSRIAATDIEAVDSSNWPEGVLFVQCTPTTLPFQDADFDAVIVRSVMEHVDEPAIVLKEVSRVLRPGGVVLLNLPNKWDYVSVLARLSGRMKSGVLGGTRAPQWEDFPVFYRANTRRDLLRALQNSGLRIEQFRPLPSEPAYLSFFVPFYMLGALYQCLVSVLLLDFLQPSFLVMLRKVD